MRLTADYPPVWLAGFAGAAWGVGWVAPLSVPRGPGLVLVVAGLALMGVAAAQMLARRTTVDPHGQPSALVTGGVFRRSRNPIYLGDAMVLGGVCLLAGAPHALPLVAVFMAVIARRFIAPEEARLAAAFPDAFARWAAVTRRWL